MDRKGIKVICGKCKKEIKEMELKTPILISDWDKKNNNTRSETYNCCGRTWLMEYGKSIDYGPEIL